MSSQTENGQFEGIWTALWTPTDENGALKKEALDKHLDFLLSRGVNGIALCGSTGQFPYLSVATRKELLHHVVEKIGPNRVFVNISDIRQANVKELAQHANEEKVAAVMLLPQMYYPYEQLDLTTYFVTMAKIANRPLILYNYPECVRNRIEMETIDNVSGEVPLLGIKQSGSDFAYHRQLIDLGRKYGFNVYTGSDTRLQEAFTLGVVGNIGGMSNALPELIVKLYQSFKKNDLVAMKDASDKIAAIGRLLSRVPFPVSIAALMEAKNLEPGAHKEILSPTTLYEYGELVLALRETLAQTST